MRKVAENVWAGGDSLDVDIVEQIATTLDFNATRCRHAEFFKELGLADMGNLVHRSRDNAMVVGFNDDIEPTRTQTIMQGVPCCDFRFRTRRPAST